ncbi:MAG: hypothetical protein Q9166_000158 [cf. Caloplaca sp. 2 TL-2023]
MSSGYRLPRNDVEHERLREQHNAIVALQHGTVSFAPVSSPKKILDIGSGTGPLSLYFAHTHPEANVYGVDPTLPPPEYVEPKPTNLSFIASAMPQVARENASGLFDKSTFDLCFSRLVLQGIRDWPSHIETVASLVKPGGYVEVQDIAWEFFKEAGRGVGEDPRMDDEWEWLNVVYRAAQKDGLDFRCGRSMAGWMRDAGLEVIIEKKHKWPFGTWLADRGEEQTRVWGEHFGKASVGLMSEVLKRVLLTAEGVSQDDIDKYLEEIRRTMHPEDGKYLISYITVGRKPL